jgi:hypothetical protein
MGLVADGSGGASSSDDGGAGFDNADGTFTPPADEGPAETGAGCDFDGTWATILTIPVSWTPQGLMGIILAPGTGTIHQWIKGVRTQQGTSLTDTTVVCGIQLPPFSGTAIAGGETYGVVFPPMLFNEPAGFLPTFLIHATVTGFAAGATYTTEASAVLIGVALANPTTDPWPSVITTPVDSDHDGKPGVTIDVAQGPPYSDIPVDVFKQARADRLYVAIRQITIATGSVDDCDHISGSVSIPQISQKPAIDSHVIGCEIDGGTDCTSSQASFVDNTQPVFTPSGMATFKSIRLPNSATCQTVRSMVP